VAASLAIAAGVVGGLAGSASAAEPDGTATFLGPSEINWDIFGKFDFASQASAQTQAGLIRIQVTGEDHESLAYCIEATQPFGFAPGGYPLTEKAPGDSGVANPDIVAKIMNAYFPLGSGPDGYELTSPTDKEKAAATQAAIWHYTNGYVMSEQPPLGTPPDGLPHQDTENIYADYLTIIQAVEDDALPAPAGDLTLSLEAPPDVDPVPGQLVGPYIVHTNAASVTLVPDAGLTVHKANGDAFGDTAHDGDELWLKATADATLALKAQATGMKSGVRFFTNDEFQDFGFAVVSPQSVETKVEVTFTTPPPTTAPPTTAPPETTVPTTPETTVITPQTTAPPETTVPVTPSGSLPVTGAQSLLLVALALVLVGIGTAFGIVSRRRRDAET
jgi:TQXA domain-containing protein/LPXTG-motif cell wall-anchored protein